MRSLICALLAGLAVCVASAGGTAEVNPAVRTHGLIQPDVQHIIVKLRTVTAVKAEIRAAQATSRVAALAARAGLALHKSQQLFGDVHVMQVDPAVVGDSVATTLARLRADSEVEYAEPDQRRFAHAVPNDPLFSGQWYLQGAAATPSAIDAVSAWDTTTGSAGVVIADLDTGVRFEHPDLQWAPIGRLLPG